MFVTDKVRFGDFAFDLRDHRLSGPSGEVALNVKSAAVLAYLLQRPGRIVTKDELLRSVWIDTAVTDDALVQRILDIRRALGDSSRESRYIRTHPKRGYEFVADANAATHSARETFAGQRRWWFAFIAVTAIVALAVFASTMRRAAVVPTPVDSRIGQLTFLSGMEDYPVFDAAGRRILFASDEGGTANLWMLDLASSERRALTSGKANLSEPDWSPDSTWIAYRSEEGLGALYASPADLREPVQVAPFGHHPRWSPDGQRIAFHTTLNGSEIYIWSRRDRTLRKVEISAPAMGGRSWPTWSGDGKYIYFVASVQFESSASQPESRGWVTLGNQIWRVPVEGGAAKVVTPGTGVLKAGGFDFDIWRSHLIFVGLDRSLWRSELDPATGAEKSKPVRLTLSTQGHQHPRVSRNGEIAFSAIAAPESLWLAKFDDAGRLSQTKMDRLTEGAASVRGPSLSPDGRRIAFFLWQGERFELWLLDLKTHDVRPIGPQDRLSRTSPIWGADGRELSYLVLEGRNREWRSAAFDSGFTKLLAERTIPGPTSAPGSRKRDPTGRFDLFVKTEDGRQRLWLAEAGGAGHAVTDPGPIQSASWAADGKRIYFQTDRDGWFNIWALDFDPSRSRVRGLPVQISSFRGSPYMLSDNNLGFAVQKHGLIVPLRENRSDLWVIRRR